MKFLVVGGSGMLGQDLILALRGSGHEVDAPSHQDLDISEPASVARLAVEPAGYDWCINCAAYTAVDKAEAEVRAATELNQFAPGYLASACSMAGIKIIHLSTDFVFDGASTEPYLPSDAANPLGIYGRTKREGELAVLRSNTNSLIVRTSWLYGNHGRCFPKTMIEAWKAGKQLRVVSDQTGCPTYTVDLARVLLDMAQRNAYPGIYHACGPDATTWHEFAVKAISAYRDKHGISQPVEIAAIHTDGYPTPAKRPKYSVLNCQAIWGLGIQPMRPLDACIKEFVSNL